MVAAVGLRRAGATAALIAASASCERDLVLAAQAGDHGASESLTEAFMPLISTVARMYRGTAGVDRGELMQEGVLGLLCGERSPSRASG